MTQTFGDIIRIHFFYRQEEIPSQLMMSCNQLGLEHWKTLPPADQQLLVSAAVQEFQQHNPDREDLSKDPDVKHVVKFDSFYLEGLYEVGGWHQADLNSTVYYVLRKCTITPVEYSHPVKLEKE
jgi:hypothetical protein